MEHAYFEGKLHIIEAKQHFVVGGKRKEDDVDFEKASLASLAYCASCGLSIDILGRGGGGSTSSEGSYRDRFTRSVFCCSLSCAHTQAAETAVDQALELRSIGLENRESIDFSLRWRRA